MIRENRYREGNVHTLRLKLQNVITGRDNEIEAIKMQFDTVQEGQSALTIITGDIGVGKTTLVKAALSDLAKLNATWVYAKSEQYKQEEPYIAIIQIIEHITNHILTLPEEKLGRIGKELKKKLGKDGALITDIVPQTERIIGKLNKTKVNDYQKLKIRLEKAFRIFITIAAKELFPLIIFIDDLQWADKPSWNIVKSINDAFSEFELYIILAYRNNREDYRARMKSMINELAGNEYLLEISLESLTYEAVKAMLMDVFAGDIENVDQLVRLIYRKTMGNPLYIKQTINLLLDNKGICYHSKQGVWRLESENIETFNLPNDIEDIINRKIDGLSHQAKEFLESAACIGSRFSMEQLKKIINMEEDLMEKKLSALCGAGLLVETLERSGNGPVKEFEFSHDRINQIVYEQMNPDRREQLHFDIAMQLLNHSDKIYIEDNLLTITAHLLNCKNMIIREGVKDGLVVDLFFAGIKAKQSAAVEHALKLFSFCEELLDNSCWRKDYDQTLRIKLELAQCEYICGLYDASRAHFEEMLNHATSIKDLVEIKKRYMILNSYTGNYVKVIDLGLQALRHLGFNINMQRLQIQVAKEILLGKILFRNSRLESIKNAPILNNKNIIEAMEILTIMAPSANLTDENLFALIVLKTSNISAKYGNSLYSPLGYAGYSLILGSVLGDFKRAKKVEEISLSLVELIDDNALKCTTYFVIGTFIDHWTSFAEKSFNYLQKSFDYGIQSGEFLFCGFTINSMIETKYSMGEPLKELEKFLKLHQKYGKKMNHDVLLRLINIFKDHINMLQSLDFPLENRLIGDEEIEQLDTSEAMTYYLLKLQRLYLEGKIEKAYDLSQKTIKQLDSVMGYFLQVDFVFYFLLLSLEKKKSRKESPYSRNERTFKKYRKKLQVWAELSPENHRGKHLLIEALYRSVNNKQQDVAKLYEEAIEHAQENHNLLLEALGNFLAAGYYSSNRKIAEVYARDACRLFNQWGSGKIAGRVGELYEIHDDIAVSEVAAAIIADEIPGNTGRERNISFDQRLQDCQKELEVLELEASFIFFLNTVCEEAKADLGAILLEEEEQLKLAYMWQNGGEATGYPVGIDPEQVEHLPQKIIRYTSRTYEEVIIDAKPTEGIFASDDYIRSRAGISIISLPLKYKGIFAGIVYLESRCNYGFDAMTTEYIKSLSFYLIAKQALEKEPENCTKAIIDNNKHDQLTDREAEVLYYMAAGMSNKEIGAKLGISASTVKTHTLNLYGKLEVSSRIQAVTKAKTLGLV